MITKTQLDAAVFDSERRIDSRIDSKFNALKDSLEEITKDVARQQKKCQDIETAFMTGNGNGLAKNNDIEEIKERLANIEVAISRIILDLGKGVSAQDNKISRDGIKDELN